MHMNSFFIGIDIQVRRNCSYAVIDNEGVLVQSGWLSNPISETIKIVQDFKGTAPTRVGIDAPRMPLIEKRQWYCDGSRRRWKATTNQTGCGRHCEIVLAAHRIANPQWTPLAENAPEWMQIGFKLYDALTGMFEVHEVFPTASYTLLSGVCDVRLDIDFSACRPGPKDMLDAWVSAATVREYALGKGCQIGGGDGLGTIILPRPLQEPVIGEVLRWPAS